MRRRLLSLLALLTVLTIVAAACGGSVEVSSTGDDESADDGETADDGEASDDGEAADGEEPTEEPTEAPTEEPTEEPTEAPTEEPTMAPEEEAEAEAAVEEVFSGNLPASASSCVVGELLQQPRIFEQVTQAETAGTIDQLDPRVQVVLVDITLGCLEPDDIAPFLVGGLTEGLSGSGLDLPEGTGDCLARGLNQSEERVSLVVGLLALNSGVVPQPAVRAPLVRLFAECLPGSLLVDAIIAGAGSDPLFAAAVDEDCLRATYDDPAVREGFWEAVVATGQAEFDSLPVEQQQALIEPLFGCLSFGQILADEAANRGVTLSASSIACVDDRIAAEDLLSDILAGDMAAEEALGAVLVECLTPEEIGALG